MTRTRSARPSPRFVSEVLDVSRHGVSAFTCGEASLDTWLRDHADHAARMNTARTFVWTDAQARSADVVAYYALSAHLLAAELLPRRVSRGGPRELPAVLLAKLALSSSVHGQGLGAQLLVDALRRVVRAAHQGPAARVVLVDALTPAAAAFYQRYGFLPIPDNPTRLVQKMSDIEAIPGLQANE